MHLNVGMNKNQFTREYHMVTFIKEPFFLSHFLNSCIYESRYLHTSGQGETFWFLLGRYEYKKES